MTIPSDPFHASEIITLHTVACKRSILENFSRISVPQKVRSRFTNRVVFKGWLLCSIDDIVRIT